MRPVLCVLVLLLAGWSRAAPYDQSQHVPIMGVAVGHGGVMLLYDAAFECRAGKRAALLGASGRLWLGCWTLDGKRLRIVFEDGDIIDDELSETPAARPLKVSDT